MLVIEFKCNKMGYLIGLVEYRSIFLFKQYTILKECNITLGIVIKKLYILSHTCDCPYI